MSPLPCSSPIIPSDSPKGEEVILGYEFLYHFNPIIDWKNGLITYDASYEDSSGIKSSTSNALATAVTSVALFVELKAPYLPSSVQIPSIMPSQSLLKSRDEVFNKIKDVGEDVAVSSLHLFQGDMDLPPLYFHASLEEKWDEEEEQEEIETVLKVVPSAYHQYLDVFSKFKAAHTVPVIIILNWRVFYLQLVLSTHYQIKKAFTTAPILSHFNPSLPAIVETDASDYSLGAVLSQVNDSGKHPIAFDSFKLLPAELNYGVHEKELLGIVCTLKRWRAFLLSLSNHFEVLKDHSSLQYFMSPKILTHCQARWAEFLSEFHFTITYHPGRLATLPDAFSCQDDVYSERGVDFICKNPQNYDQVIKQDEIQDSRFFSIKVEIFSNSFSQIQKEVWQDKDYKEILNQLARGESVPDYSLEPQAKLLLLKDRVVVPSNEEIQLNILQTRHDSPLVGHPGQEKTLKLIKRDFFALE
ncbi:hypothetical protein O181_005145 [Austropuccinia psidii MF-1]|uniref:Reverse transcriptase RNase H-like domain-containing protein n=1 Tax=Austropuccinia psidii MF-1 TaxID=1389203 RepID=A0A9Q3GFJ5_9BASI|nr:hypothetical protein [Austropuccinia psidii MF-1]